VLLFTGFSLSGCGTPQLSKPQVTSIGPLIHWNDVENASSYIVYEGDKVVQTTFSTYFIADSLSSTLADVTVIAHSDSESFKDSNHSNAVSIYKNSGFLEDESQHIELQENKTYDIPESVNYVSVAGTAKNSNVVVENRSKQLLIELDNAILSSAEGETCISTADNTFDFAKKPWTTIIKASGFNTLSGGSTITKPATPADDQEITGTNGKNGGCGIVLPQIVFYGSGSLVCTGGNGGPGGDGSACTTWSTNTYGHGGNGGDGGSGFKCTTIALAMETGGNVSSSAGEGGARGKAGENGSIITGPMGSGFWEGCCGSAGKKGSNYVGILQQYRGSFNS